MNRRWWLLPAAAAIALAATLVPKPPPPVRDVPLAPASLPDRSLRIVALGTSLTTRGTWADDLQMALAQCLGLAVGVERIAGAGERTQWGLNNLDRVVAAAPDIVLIEFAINDADITDGVWLSDSIDQHRALLMELRRALPGARPLLMTMNHVHGLARLTRPRLGAFYAAYQPLAEEFGTGLADFYPRWRRAPAGQARFPDGVHPASADQSAIMVPVLTALIGESHGRDCGS